MEAVVLSAGQGRRLLPLTRAVPKCLLPVAPGGGTVLDVQLDALARCGVSRVTLLVGFGAEHVARHVEEQRHPSLDVRLELNPLHPHSDNLVSAWLASTRVDGDFVLMNGDTLFEAAVLQRLLDADVPMAAAVDHKDAYDDDDMCVWIEAGRLVGIGKDRRERPPSGEAIGVYAFRGPGVAIARDGFATALAKPEGLRAWYPPVLEEIARGHTIAPISIEGLWWTEIDVPEDLEKARVAVGSHLPHLGPPPVSGS